MLTGNVLSFNRTTGKGAIQATTIERDGRRISPGTYQNLEFMVTDPEGINAGVVVTFKVSGATEATDVQVVQ